MTQSTITLRPAEISDISALDGLFLRSYSTVLRADYPPSALVTAIPIMARAQPALVNSGLFFVAESGGAVIGAGGWSLRPPQGMGAARGVGHVRHVATDPGHLRRGVGRTLLAHIMLHAKASGMAMMQCQSTLTAVPFYESMGFVARGETRVPMPGGINFPAVSMDAVL